MNDVVIHVDQLSKIYNIGKKEDSYRTFRDVLSSAIAAPFRKLGSMFHNSTGNDKKESIYALKDVSFEVKRGEVLGVIGRNGAGKSTLLKILSKITEPSDGYAEIRGSVSSLLEVGTGFHPELTGSENIFLNGAILGMKKAEIEKKFDEIVSFAEIEKFLYTPVKHYSSGMYVRLAFAIAAHLEPEVLLIDEVLAVGDVAFQKKCLGKMKSVAHEGRTVLFVSHNMAAVESLCQRGIVLSNGQVAVNGTQLEAISYYLSDVDTSAVSLRDRSDRTGSSEIRVTEIEYRDENGKKLTVLRSGQTIDIYLHYESIGELQHGDVIASVAVKTQMESPVFLLHNRLTGDHWEDIPSQGSFVCRIKKLPLPASVYRLGYTLIRHGQYLDGLSNAQEMIVDKGDFFGTGEIPPISHGVCLTDAEWRLES
ncbi:ABC transporter ATP-binding protein [bacterium]|nr:ABC transporter ATP-binding protein [bacterium]